MRILAADDDPIASLVLESSLRSLGHEVALATNGQEAWAQLATQSFRVVVSDWTMPHVDGLELCRRLRARGGDYTYFILLTSVEASEENHEAALKAGVDDFLAKPVNLRELRMRLHVAERILNYVEQVRTLETFLPICSYCKKVRDDHQYWASIESYINARTGTRFSHSICPDCLRNHVHPQLEAMGIDPRGLPPQSAP